MRVPQRRRGAAPQRRPGRRPALRLRHVLPGRRAQRSSPASTSPTSRRRTPSTSPRPTDWVVLGNAPGDQVEPGRLGARRRPSRCRRTSSPWSPGPYHVIRDEHDGIPLGLSARAPASPRDLDADADELFTMTRQCFDEFHRLFGIRYPFGDYHQAFVPEFNAGAMENPGCVTFRDPLVFTSPGHPRRAHRSGPPRSPTRWRTSGSATSSPRSGGTTCGSTSRSPSTWATGSPPTSPSTPTPGSHNAYARRQWGLVADQRPSTHPVAGNGAVDAARRAAGLRRHLLRQGLEHPQAAQRHARRRGVLRRRDRPLHRHRFGNATMHDLFASWERAGAGDLSPFTEQLAAHRRPGHDRARPRGRRRAAYSPGRTTPPTAPHAFRVATAAPGGHVGGRAARRVDAPGDAVRRARRAPPWCSTPTRTPGRSSSPTPTTVAALEAAAARPPTTPGCAPGSGTTSAAPSTTPPSTRPTCSTCSRPALPVEDSDDAVFYTLPWALAKVVPLSADPGGRAAPRPRRRARARSRDAPPGSTLQLAAFQAAISSRHRRRAAALLAGRAGAARRHRGRPRPALADPGAARRARRDRPRRAGRGARRRADRALARRARAGDGLAARRRGQGLGLGSGSPARSTCPTTSSRRPALGMWRTGPGAPHRRRTSTATSPTLPAHRARCAAAGCWPTPPQASSRPPR